MVSVPKEHKVLFVLNPISLESSIFLFCCKPTPSTNFLTKLKLITKLQLT